MCKSHYIDCLIKELGIDKALGNPTYTLTTFWTFVGLFCVPLDSF